jgi:hypothetical protein
MNTIDKIRNILKLSQLRKFYAEGKLDDGRAIATEAESWAVGVEVYVIGEDGTAEPLADGDYVLEDGTPLKVEGGRLAQLGAEAPAEEVEAVEMAEEDPMLAELKAIGLEDDMAAKVMDLMKGYKKEEMAAEVLELAKQTAEGFQALNTRLSKLEETPGSTGTPVTPAPQKTNLSAQAPAAFGWENALNVIHNFK